MDLASEDTARWEGTRQATPPLAATTCDRAVGNEQDLERSKCGRRPGTLGKEPTCRQPMAGPVADAATCGGVAPGHTALGQDETGG